MAGNAAEEIGVVMVLAAQELFVVIQFERHTDLMASRTELGRLMSGLQESRFVKLRFRFNQLVVHELQKFVGAESKRIMDRLFDRVISVPARAVYVRD